MKKSFVLVNEQKHVATVRMNRPDVRNAFNPEMIEELTRVFTEFEKRKDLRAVIFSGEGRIFCAGADLSWMRAMVNYSLEENREDSQKLFRMFEAMALCPVPILGMVHGAVYGGALGLLACCDEVVAEAGTTFCFSEVKLGIVPAVVSSFVLRKANHGLIRPLMLSARVFEVEEARQVGLVHHVVESGMGAATAERLALNWCEAGPEAVRETKRLLNDQAHMTWEQSRERTSRLIAERRVSSEGQEGLKSFLEKRNPSWRDL